MSITDMSSVYYTATAGRFGTVDIVVKCAECNRALYTVPAGNIVEPSEIVDALTRHATEYKDDLCSDPEGRL